MVLMYWGLNLDLNHSLVFNLQPLKLLKLLRGSSQMTSYRCCLCWKLQTCVRHVIKCLLKFKFVDFKEMEIKP